MMNTLPNGSSYHCCQDCQSPIYLRTAYPKGIGKGPGSRTFFCTNNSCYWTADAPPRLTVQPIPVTEVGPQEARVSIPQVTTLDSRATPHLIRPTL